MKKTILYESLYNQDEIVCNEFINVISNKFNKENMELLSNFVDNGLHDCYNKESIGYTGIINRPIKPIEFNYFV